MDFKPIFSGVSTEFAAAEKVIFKVISLTKPMAKSIPPRPILPKKVLAVTFFNPKINSCKRLLLEFCLIYFLSEKLPFGGIGKSFVGRSGKSGPCFSGKSIEGFCPKRLPNI